MRHGVSTLAARYWLVPLLFLILYLFFPSTNNTLDSLGYAANVREGTNLLAPHHLLSNLPAYLLSRLLDTSDTLALICGLNAVFGAGCLSVSGRILRLVGLRGRAVAYYLLMLGSCYGLMRFATDAEAYVLPLFVALCATWVQIRSESEGGDRVQSKYLEPLMVGLLMAVACLFHQIYFFWFLGLGLKYILGLRVRTRLAMGLVYASAGSVVIVTYLMVYLLLHQQTADGFFGFVLHDYYAYADVGIDLGRTALLLTPINVIRTFVQVHGYIPSLLALHPLCWLIPLVSLTLWLKGLSYVLPLRCFHAQGNASRGAESRLHRAFGGRMLIICGLQLSFAFLSSGNAEFMSMLPFSLLFFLATRPGLVPLRGIGYGSLGIFVWNVSLALVPMNLLVLQPIRPVAEFVVQHPRAVYFLREAVWTEQYLRYHFPAVSTAQIWPASRLQALSTMDTTGVCTATPLYTDLHSPATLSRAGLTARESVAVPSSCIVSTTDTLHSAVGYILLEGYVWRTDL